MGIPALFRWLTQKYPKITTSVFEEQPKEINGFQIPVDFSQPNPNGFEVDNLYLDMNNIIHPCCHPEDKPAPKNEDEMFIEIFKYIDRIIAMSRPRKILYMAIDGVAPRAKMNQQRSRRFRAGTEATEKLKDEQKVREEYESKHGKQAEKEEKEIFDSNCITPGTPFMATLSIALKFYIADRMNSSPGWTGLKVILSDASIPGEGEHKVMDFIRRQRNQETYDPNTMHVLYGLDADLIMLALATHEVHFKILREDVFFGERENSSCYICGQGGHLAANCTGKAKEKSGAFDEIGQNLAAKPYVYLHINLLREYLEIELKIQDLPFWNFERAIDDYVFLCFFVGNDFLPHLPSLEIREGAIDKLIDIWKVNLIKFGGYMTDSGDISLDRVCILLHDLGHVEDEIFKKRREDEERRRSNKKRREEQTEQQAKRFENKLANSAPEIAKTMGSIPSYGVKTSMEDQRKINFETVEAMRSGVQFGGKHSNDNKNASILLKLQLLGKSQVISQAKCLIADELKEPAIQHDTVKDEINLKRKAEEDPEVSSLKNADNTTESVVGIDATALDVPVNERVEEIMEEIVLLKEDPIKVENILDASIDQISSTPDNLVTIMDADEPADNVRLWEQGWKKRYYQKKFEIDENDLNFRKKLVTSYVEGCCWVLKYYYQGCPSWQWFYPYHYSPFASDFDFIGELDIQFILGKPFKPYEQLMGVLPYTSRHHIPPVFHDLMHAIDSPILDFYPEEFPVDLNGKKHAWQGVALLPFIDQDRLLNAMDTVYDGLTELEISRNEIGNELLWVGQHHPTFDKLCVLYAKQGNQPIALNPQLTMSLNGTVTKDPEIIIPGCVFYSPLVNMGISDIEDNQCISAVYIMPQYPENSYFKADLLPTVRMPRKTLTSDDYYAIKMGLNNNRGRGRGDRRMNIENSGNSRGYQNTGTSNTKGYPDQIQSLYQQSHMNYQTNQVNSTYQPATINHQTLNHHQYSQSTFQNQNSQNNKGYPYSNPNQGKSSHYQGYQASNYATHGQNQQSQVYNQNQQNQHSHYQGVYQSHSTHNQTTQNQGVYPNRNTSNHNSAYTPSVYQGQNTVKHRHTHIQSQAGFQDRGQYTQNSQNQWNNQTAPHLHNSVTNLAWSRNVSQNSRGGHSSSSMGRK